MIKFSFWQRLSDYGTEGLSSIPERKRHRIANQLLAAVVLFNLAFGVLEIIVYLKLLSLDREKHFHYLYFYTVPGVIIHFLAAATYVLKNRSHNMNYTFLMLPPLVAYITMFCFYLGNSLMVHLILFALIPIPFFVYARHQIRAILLHEISVILGVAAAYTGYWLMQPLLPVTPEIENMLRPVPVLTVIVILCLISYYHWKQSNLSESLLEHEKKHTENLLNNIIPKHEQAEKKYRHLVEGSGDIIFSMNQTGEIITINKAVKAHLGFSPAEIQGRKFEELVYTATGGKSEIETDLFRSYLRDLLDKKKSVAFRIPLRQKLHAEPAELSVLLELAESDEELEILGKAMSTQDDLILNFLQRERGRFAIGNSIGHADILSHKLTCNLSKVLPGSDIQSLRISLREMLINAIEHGNLGVTFEEKTRAQEEGDFMDFLKVRQQDPRYAGKRVFIDYIFDGQKVAYQITDEGLGFNHRDMMADNSETANAEFLAHGRGITMTRNTFSLVRYNKTGNKVILVKHFNRTVE